MTNLTAEHESSLFFSKTFFFNFIIIIIIIIFFFYIWFRAVETTKLAKTNSSADMDSKHITIMVSNVYKYW